LVQFFVVSFKKKIETLITCK